MSKANTKCRVCGKEYFCCSDSKRMNSWRTMACSVGCFQEYMNRIEKSRRHPNENMDAVSFNKTMDAGKVKERKKKSMDNPVEEQIIIEN